MRTTVNIDDPILRDLKRLQRREGKSLGRLVSDLLAFALHERRGAYEVRSDFRWTAGDMGARVNLDDRAAVLDAMDAPAPREKSQPKKRRR